MGVSVIFLGVSLLTAVVPPSRFVPSAAVPLAQYVLSPLPLLTLPVMLVSVYFSLRLYPAAYGFVLAPLRPARTVLKESFAATRKRVTLFVGLSLSFLGWVMLGVVAAGILALPFLPGGSGVFAFPALMLLPMVLVYPYMYTAMAGLADWALHTPHAPPATWPPPTPPNNPPENPPINPN